MERKRKIPDKISAKLKGRIRKILAEDQDFLVPVKKLHRHFLAGEDLPEYPRFLALLKADPGLVVMDLEDKADDGDWDEAEMPASSEAEMEALGFYTGPRVRLKERVPSLADLAAILKRHTDRMMESLGQAYVSAADQLSEEEEDAMMDLLKHAKSLKGAVDKIGGMPEEEGKNDGKRGR